VAGVGGRTPNAELVGSRSFAGPVLDEGPPARKDDEVDARSTK